MLNNLIIYWTGDWRTADLQNNGEGLAVCFLKVEVHTGRDEDGREAIGGFLWGGELGGVFRRADQPHQEHPLFPGEVTCICPNGEKVVVVNHHPLQDPSETQIYLLPPETTRVAPEYEITPGLVDLEIEFDLTEPGAESARAQLRQVVIEERTLFP